MLRAQLPAPWSRLLHGPQCRGTDAANSLLKRFAGILLTDFLQLEGNFLLNIQAICGLNLYFYDVVPRWPECTHDNYIFENSALNSMLEEGQFLGHLLGDSGHGIKAYQLNPYPDPGTHIKKRYSKRHSQTRMYIEKAFGYIK